MNAPDRGEGRFLRVVGDDDAQADRLRAKGEALDLKSGGGDGTSGGMEARVTRLETSLEFIKRDVGELRSDVSGLKVDFARLDERVKNLPSKGFIVSASITIIGLLTAALVFADKLREALGVTH